jgi:glycosyltransferase involved in cell wall biosynthesis/peptidoglycan/xylan/chitin deacetylase (PgdA/CDA1 family)
MKRTVAHVVLSLEAGGLEALVCSLVETPRLSRRRTLVACLDSTGALAERARRAGAEIVRLKRGRGLDLPLVLRLARWLRRERVGVLHTHSLDPLLYGGLAGLLAGVPVRVHTQHNVMLKDYGATERFKFRLGARACTKIVSVSEEVDRRVAALRVPARKRAVILNGVDADAFASAAWPAVEALAGRPSLVIGTVARLAPEKGLLRLIEAFARLRSARADVRLLIAGEGPERPSLEALTRRLALDESVTFLGFQEHVAGVLARLDVFALSSLTEGIPLALLEAMGRGLPVVATRVGGVPEVVVEEESGLLVPADDSAALAAALGRLAGDPELRVRLGAAAATRVRQHFSLEATARAYERLYDETAEEGRIKGLLKAKALQRLPARWLAWRGRPEARSIALTFDDGPDAVFTPKLLDVLARHRVRGTFFLVGERVTEHPDLVRRIVAEGHELGNHSFTHPEFGRISLKQADEEIERTQRVLEEIQGHPCRWFRPPKGKLCSASLLGAWRRRLTVLMWSADLKDFRATEPEQILDAEVVRPFRDGDVVLYHGNSDASLTALPQLIGRALRDGRRAVTVSGLLG